MAIEVIQVAGMHCASCGMLIDDVLEDLPGVVASETNVRAGSTMVEHDGSVTTRQIIDAIDGVGYSASAT